MFRFSSCFHVGFAVDSSAASSNELHGVPANTTASASSSACPARTAPLTSCFASTLHVAKYIPCDDRARCSVEIGTTLFSSRVLVLCSLGSSVFVHCEIGIFDLHFRRHGKIQIVKVVSTGILCIRGSSAMNNGTCDGALYESLDSMYMMTRLSMLVLSKHSMPMLMSGDGFPRAVTRATFGVSLSFLQTSLMVSKSQQQKNTHKR